MAVGVVVTNYPPIGEAVRILAGLYRVPAARAAQVVAAGVRDGEIAVVERDDRGNPRPIFLAGAEIDALDWVTGANREPAMSWSIGDVEFSTIERVLFLHLPSAEGYAARHLAAPAGPAKGGRPPVHDWALAALLFARYVHQAGIPQPLARAVDFIAAEMEARTGTAPDARDLRRRIAQWIAEIEKPIGRGET